MPGTLNNHLGKRNPPMQNTCLRFNVSKKQTSLMFELWGFGTVAINMLIQYSEDEVIKMSAMKKCKKNQGSSLGI